MKKILIAIIFIGLSYANAIEKTEPYIDAVNPSVTGLVTGGSLSITGNATVGSEFTTPYIVVQTSGVVEDFFVRDYLRVTRFGGLVSSITVVHTMATGATEPLRFNNNFAYIPYNNTLGFVAQQNYDYVSTMSSVGNYAIPGKFEAGGAVIINGSLQTGSATTLPTTGVREGGTFWNSTNKCLYVATETVVGAQSWTPTHTPLIP